MVGNGLKLNESNHPNKEAKELYESLVSLDDHKAELLRNLQFLLDTSRIDKWIDQYHSNGLNMLQYLRGNTPLVILSGEVGCGKTALAQSIGTPVAEMLQKKIVVLETPSNIRGSGMVGEISNRITEAFETAKAKVRDGKFGILVIDEADDIATSRSQNQAHHEDRAGLNVLIKQIDLLKREKTNLAVILITNRLEVLDPAVRRRVSLHLKFERPTGEKLKDVFRYILQGTKYDDKDVDDLVRQVSGTEIPYSFSDLIQRAGKQALFKAVERNEPFSLKLYKRSLESIEPTPLIEIGNI